MCTLLKQNNIEEKKRGIDMVENREGQQKYKRFFPLFDFCVRHFDGGQSPM